MTFALEWKKKSQLQTVSVFHKYLDSDTMWVFFSVQYNNDQDVIEV